MIFDNVSLKNEIEKTLDTHVNIPEGHRGALVTIVDASGVRCAVATNVGKGWMVAGDIGYVTHKGGLEAGITVQKTW
ncbi:MAG TPA: hypothetical protein VNX68_04750 [Nitrosopumilaceae archaeon]|jgi:hypothetical protein|nr:hypothetical protein [Nitrosopumilaceae archaeon]